jgi:hypothetical protein
MQTKKDLFDFIIKRVHFTATKEGYKPFEAFVKWFSKMYFPGFLSYELTDGKGDGKVDALIKCEIKNNTRYHIINSKYTEQYNINSPSTFYDEISTLWFAFINKSNRENYLQTVREELRPKYKKMFELFDDDKLDLFFLTNHKKNDTQFSRVKKTKIKIIHLEELVSYVSEHIEGAMPETEPLILSGISTVLTPSKEESEVPTSIVFARLYDFIKYMEEDPFELLFARNVRLWLGNTETNKDIKKTFREKPKEFAFSNNGITILCKNHRHEPGEKELTIYNPRIVNGSQTLHSIKGVDNPSKKSRVMVRIIEIPPETRGDLSSEISKRKEIIHKISLRTNMQNPIKRWNLVSNDDFNNSISQYFWQKGLYYERRQNEWKMRRTQLQNERIKKGPSLTMMTKIIAAYFYNEKYLGPANAQGRLLSLFEENAYKKIRELTPSHVYQLYLLYQLFLKHLSILKKVKKNKHISALGNYANMAVFSIICRSLKDHKFNFNIIDNENKLEKLLDVNSKILEESLLNIINYLLKDHDRKQKKFKKSEGKELPYSVFFKNATYINNLISKVPKNILNKLYRVFKD